MLVRPVFVDAFILRSLSALTASYGLPTALQGSGDVKYHLGMSSDVHYADLNRSVHLSLLANPSHLETVDPVVEGKARAEQDYRGDTARRRVRDEPSVF